MLTCMPIDHQNRRAASVSASSTGMTTLPTSLPGLFRSLFELSRVMLGAAGVLLVAARLLSALDAAATGVTALGRGLLQLVLVPSSSREVSIPARERKGGVGRGQGERTNWRSFRGCCQP